MTIITMPSTPAFKDSQFGLEYNTALFESPLTRQQQVVERAGARWRGTYSLPPMLRAQAAEWQGFLAALKGQANTFYGYDPDARTPRGTNLQVGASANYTVNGDAVGSTTSWPTLWSGTLGSGVTATFLGSGSRIVGGNTINGFYIRYSSGSTSSTQSTIRSNNLADAPEAATIGETWTGSAYMAITAGSISNITLIRLALTEGNAAGSSVGVRNGSDIKASLSGTPQRFEYASPLSGTGVTRVRLGFDVQYTSGAAIDITLFIGAVQCERATTATPYIATTGTAATRNANLRVYGTGQLGSSLNVRGLAADGTGLLLAGDYFELDGKLYMVTAPVSSNYKGEATINFAPALFSAPVSDSLLTTINPKCEMRLVDDGQASWGGDAMGLMNLSFQAVQVV